MRALELAGKRFGRLVASWATRTEQNRNTRGNRMVTANGHTRSIAEWSELLGWPHHVITSRLRSGWTEARAGSEPWKPLRPKP